MNYYPCGGVRGRVCYMRACARGREGAGRGQKTFGGSRSVVRDIPVEIILTPKNKAPGEGGISSTR